jgi:microcompartment protein CcmK/EutM
MTIQSVTISARGSDYQQCTTCCDPEGAGLRINVGILIIAAGAIIAFAIRETSSQVNLTVVGIIIMLGGAAGLWLSYRIASVRDVEEITMGEQVQRFAVRLPGPALPVVFARRR